MASVVQICNIALSHIGSEPITALTEATKEARECNLHYVEIRDAVLEDHNWGFAKRRVVLAEIDEEFSGWSHAYAYPADCLCPREIYDGSATSAVTNGLYNSDVENYSTPAKIRYEVAINSAKDARVILTDQEDAELIYTATIADPNLFTRLFRSALSYSLAARLAEPLHSDRDLGLRMEQKYLLELSKAKRSDGNADSTPPRDDGDFIRARR